MDAMASEVQRRGDAFMSKWAEIMTNMQPKTYFFRPDVAAQVRLVASHRVRMKRIGQTWE
jgi:hypothetical protein